MGYEKFLDVGQVAEILGLSIATIRKWVLTKYIPNLKIRRVIRFSVSEIQDLTKGKSAVRKRFSAYGLKGVENDSGA